MPDDSAMMLTAGSVADAALSGLLQPRKTLPAKLFYDEEGCRLFGRITELPEYYLTRTEHRLAGRRSRRRVAATVRGPAVLVEYGASEETKAEYLLREGEALRCSGPMCRSTSRRRSSSRCVRGCASGGRICWYASCRPTSWIWRRCRPRFRRCRASVSFPDRPSAISIRSRRGISCSARAARLGRESWFLVGVDLRKDPAILLPAYDDAQGVTAAFNRNLLVRLNREAGADFDLDAFAHRAEWNDDASRIEMHLVSLRDQLVRVAGEAIRFARGETIHTENSYKYAPEQFAELAEQAGWHSAELWTDPARLFSLHLLEPRQGP